MYAVMGITGQVGGAVARTLLGGGREIRGVVRNAAKAADWARRGVSLATADQADAASLTAAFRGTEGAFVMLPPMFVPSPDFAEARGLIAVLHSALSAASVPRVVALSTIGAQHETGIGILKSLFLMEQSLATLPMPVAFVRAAWFMENAAWDVQLALEKGELTSHLQPLDHPFPMVSTRDVGRVASEVLGGPAWTGRRVVELEGPRRYSPDDLALALSQVVGRPVQPRAIPRDQWEPAFEAQGVPAAAAALRAEMLDGFNTGHVDFGREAEHVRGSVSLDEAVAKLNAA
jgi:NAD(P)H dehydrogenase (quinone)